MISEAATNLVNYFRTSVQRKLLFFVILMVTITTVILSVFLIRNFQHLADFSLTLNSEGMEATIDDYLTKYAQEKAFSTWLQIDNAQNHLAVVGLSAQKIVDNYDEIRANPEILDFSLFETQLTTERGALTSSETDRYDALIPPSLADDPRAREVLETTGLLNLNMDAVFETNDNSAFIYFVGDVASPVTRAYPNIHLVEVLGDGLDLRFWRDYFAPNVDVWEQWYTDAGLRAEAPSPITIEPPYLDAAGQGLILTMFYPLWDATRSEFAGAVGADITLNSIIENILSIQIGRTGFAFLLNGEGELIAMPAAGSELLDTDLTPVEIGGLSYFTGSLYDSNSPAVQSLAAAIEDQQNGIIRFDPSNGADAAADVHRIVFTHLPALRNNQYEEDSWTFAIAVPESEIFEVLEQTDAAIGSERVRLRNISLGLIAAFLAAAVVSSVRISQIITRDIRTLANAAEQISAQNYDVEIKLQSRDEIGQLGQTFGLMADEIREYTTNLEALVVERTAELSEANRQITLLNEQLHDENLRLSAELDVARQLQMMVLPPTSEINAIKELDIAGYMQPADEVGGDYYDVLSVGDTVYFGIGDVTGHGLPSGVIMLMAQTGMLTLAHSGEQDMEKMLSHLNHVLYHNILRIRENKSMTLAIIRYRDRLFELVGQHESVLICRTDGQIEEIDTLDFGFPVGLEFEIEDFIATKQIEMAPGDVMLLYTDGITEAENQDGQYFGITRLKEALARSHQLAAQEILDQIIRDVHAFIDGYHIYDDISALVIKQE